MPTLKERIIELLKKGDGLTDREITDTLFGGGPQQGVNQTCNNMVAKGLLIRKRRHDGKIGNYIGSDIVSPNTNDIHNNEESSENSQVLSEDKLKKVLNDYLVRQGWRTQIAMGRIQGIDIDAYKGNHRWIIEVKGSGSRDAMRVNYFLSIIGEILQRMSDPNAKYSIALPDMKQFRNLWARFPRLAKDRTGITALFISEDESIEEIE